MFTSAKTQRAAHISHSSEPFREQAEPVHVHDRPAGPQRAPLLQAAQRERPAAHAHRVHAYRRGGVSEVRIHIP